MIKKRLFKSERINSLGKIRSHCLYPIKKVLLFLLLFLLGETLFGEAESFYLTESEESWLQEHPVIRIVPDPFFPPIEFFDKKGQYRGITSDYLKLLEEILPVEFEIIEVENWSESLRKARNRKADMFGAAAITQQRSEYMNFSLPYIEYEAVILTNDKDKKTLTLNDLKGRDVFVSSGYFIHDYLIREYPEIHLHPLDSVPECLTALSFGEADAFVGNLATISYFLEQEGITNLRLAGRTGLFYKLSLAVRNDWPEFIIILNKALDHIPQEEKLKINAKWVHFEDTELVRSRSFLIILFLTCLSILLLLFLILSWNRILNIRINVKTKELDQELKMRQNSEESLKASEERFRTLANNLPGVVYRSPNGDRKTLIYISKYIKEISGYSPEQMVEKDAAVSLYSLIQEEDRDHIIHEVDHAVKQRQPFHIHYRIKDIDGTLHWVQEHGQAQYDPLGNLQFVDGVILDETDLKQYENHMNQAKKMQLVGTLASGIAHDFNNVLTSINTSVELMDIEMKKYPLNRDNITHYIALQKMSGNRASGIVKNLLSLAKKQNLIREILDLNIILKEVIMICTPTFHSSVILSPFYPGKKALIKGDPVLLEQVFLNFLINAEHSMTIMKEGDWGGTLFLILESCKTENPLEATGQKDYWKITIEDTGVGIKSDQLDNIFTPFYTTKSGEKGTGLGLSMSYNTIISHYGFIDVHSIPGKGSRFEIYLPAESTVNIN